MERFCLGVIQFWAQILATLFVNLPPEAKVITSLNFSFLICKKGTIIPVLTVCPKIRRHLAESRFFHINLPWLLNFLCGNCYLS